MIRVNKYILIIFFSFCNIINSINAQDISIGIGGGYTKLYNNEFYTSDISREGLGLKQGIHFSFAVKYGLQPLPFRMIGYFSYLPLKSDGIISLSHVNSSFDREIGFSSNILSFGLGVEYKIPTLFFSPYLLLNMKVNKFNKTSIEEPYPVAWAPYYNTLFRSISDEIRYGIEIGIGHEFYILPKYGLDICIKYDLLNLIGKEDVKWPIPDTPTFNEKNINTFCLTAKIFFRNKR